MKLDLSSELLLRRVREELAYCKNVVENYDPTSADAVDDTTNDYFRGKVDALEWIVEQLVYY